MSPSPISVGIDASIDDVVSQMDVYDIAQVPVVNAGAVVGIVSRRELLAALSLRLSQADAKEHTGDQS